jgi:hypothetical protein
MYTEAHPMKFTDGFGKSCSPRRAVSRSSRATASLYGSRPPASRVSTIYSKPVGKTTACTSGPTPTALWLTPESGTASPFPSATTGKPGCGAPAGTAGEPDGTDGAGSWRTCCRSARRMRFSLSQPQSSPSPLFR